MAKLVIGARQSASAVNFSTLEVDGKPVEDWVIPLSITPTQVEKSGASLLSAWSYAGGSGTDPFNGGATAGTTLSWTSDGSPTASGSSTSSIRQNSFNAGDNRGFSFTCSVGTAERTIRVYVGHYAADTAADRFVLTASISDASTADQQVKWAGTTSDTDSYFDIQVAAGSAGQTVTITYQAEELSSGTLLRAVSLRGYWVSTEGDPPAPPSYKTIQYVGGIIGVDTATLPSHQAGDVIICFAYRDGNATPAALVSGWTNLGNSGANTNGSRLAYRIATDGSTPPGTWTNSTSVVYHIYRNLDPTTPIGAVLDGGGQSTTVSYPALTLQRTDNSSWVAGFAGHRSTNTSLETPPTGMTNRTTRANATDEAAGHDTNGTVSSWSNQNVSVGGTSSGWRSWTVELRAAIETTPTVESSYSSAFSIRNFASASYSSAFSVRNLVTGSYSGAFSIRNAVASDFSSAFSVRNFVTGSYESAFSIGGVVSASYESAYSIRNYIEGGYSASFSIRNLVASDYSSAYSIRNYAEGSYSSAYSIINAVNGQYDSAFSIRNYVTGEYSSAFSILEAGLVGATYSSAYSIRNYVETDVSFAYSVRNFVQGSYSSAFSILDTDPEDDEIQSPAYRFTPRARRAFVPSYTVGLSAFEDPEIDETPKKKPVRIKISKRQDDAILNAYLSDVRTRLAEQQRLENQLLDAQIALELTLEAQRLAALELVNREIKERRQKDEEAQILMLLFEMA